MSQRNTVDGSKLIAGSPLEFCTILYAALLHRLPDRKAWSHFRWNVGDDPEARLEEVRKVLASNEFQRKKDVECVFGPPLENLYDLDQRIDNFLTYCLPLLPTIFHGNEDLLALKTREISELLQAILSREGAGGQGVAQGTEFLLFSYLLSRFAPAQEDMQEDARRKLQAEFAGLHGADLVARLTEVLARQAQQIERLAATVRLLDAFEEHRDVLLQTDGPVVGEALPLAESAEILASEYLPPAGGFHALQFTKGGTPYRWCGPDGEIRFAVHLDRSREVALRLDLLFTVDPENFKRVELTDGKEPVPVRIVESGGKGCAVHASLPPRKGIAGTHLSFRFPSFRRLSDTDERIAAVAFHRLVIAPAGDGSAAAGGEARAQ